MRYLAIGLAAALCAHPVTAQQGNVTIRLDFATGEQTAGAAALATIPINRGWTDSVSSYFNDELRQRGPANLVRTQTASANFTLIIQPLPVMANNKPIGIMVYSLVLVRPPLVGTNWVYVDSTTGYSTSPAQAATSILNFLNGELRR